MWREGVWCQKFQPTKRLGRLFEVSQPKDVQQLGEDRDMQEAIQSSLHLATN
jgi:hypothetical protein